MANVEACLVVGDLSWLRIFNIKCEHKYAVVARLACTGKLVNVYHCLLRGVCACACAVDSYT